MVALHSEFFSELPEVPWNFQELLENYVSQTDFFTLCILAGYTPTLWRFLHLYGFCFQHTRVAVDHTRSLAADVASPQS